MDREDNAFYSSGEPEKEVLLEKIPSVPVWISEHFSTLPIKGWFELVKRFHQKHTNLPSWGSVSNVPQMGTFDNSVFKDIMVRSIVDQESDNLETITSFHIEDQNRSVIFPLVLFKDSDGNTYSAIVAKGVGDSAQGTGKNRYESTPEYWIRGGEFVDELAVDAQNTEILLKELGIRCPRTIAVFAINPSDFETSKVMELINKHKVFSGSYKAKLSYLGIDIRALRSPLRLSNIIDVDRSDITRIRKNIEFSMDLLMKTDGVAPNPKDYYEFFAQSLAETMGRFAEKELLHSNLISTNVTTAAEVLDFDTLRNISEAKLDMGEKDMILVTEGLEIVERLTKLGKFINTAFGDNPVDIKSSLEKFFVIYLNQVTDQKRKTRLNNLFHSVLVSRDNLRNLLIETHPKADIEDYSIQKLDKRFPGICSEEYSGVTPPN